MITPGGAGPPREAASDPAGRGHRPQGRDVDLFGISLVGFNTSTLTKLAFTAVVAAALLMPRVRSTTRLAFERAMRRSVWVREGASLIVGVAAVILQQLSVAVAVAVARSGRARRCLVVAPVALVAACAHRFGSPAEAQLRVASNPEVRWEAAGPHELAMILENTGAASMTVPLPTEAAARVAVFAPSGEVPLCEHRPERPARSPPLVALGPRQTRAVIVLLASCDLAPGSYRYEAWYEIPRVPGSQWSGRLGPERGRIVVQRPGALAPRAASRAALSPPEHAPAPGLAPPGGARSSLAPAPLSPASRSCIDRELARRGLNAWGDPAATPLPDPRSTFASDVERAEAVLRRYPAIATLCRVPP